MCQEKEEKKKKTVSDGKALALEIGGVWIDMPLKSINKSIEFQRCSDQ